jgi:dihydrofolate reductase
MICSILASTSLGGIGNRGTLPWPKHKEDLAWFKTHTTDQIVVMGRKTWDDPLMPKPLPDRINYVVSSTHVDREYQHLVRWIPSDPVANILQIQKDNPDKNVYVIGGRQLYEATEGIVERVILTRVKGAWFTDTRVQLDKMLACFQIKSVSPGTNCTYETWDRTFYFG